jgi:hypothetical protein
MEYQLPVLNRAGLRSSNALLFPFRRYQVFISGSISQLYTAYTWNVYQITATLLMNQKAEEWKLNTFKWVYMIKFIILNFQTFPSEALHSQLLKCCLK